MWGLGPRMGECGQSAWNAPLQGDRPKAWSLKAGLKPDEFEILVGRTGVPWIAKAAWVGPGKPANYGVGADLTMVYLSVWELAL